MRPSSPALSAPEAPPDDERGDTTADLASDELDRYRAQHFLGSGGMGHVIAVHDRRLDRDIALKARHPQSGRESGFDERIMREARITARLDHPGIVPIFDAGIGVDGRVYYTMPIVRGRSLADAITRAADTPTRLRLLRRVLDACESVGHAHRHGITHCDLKPSNIMLGEDGGTRVLDWGLARTAEDPVVGAVGTPRYMSPEQAAGAPADPRSDVWSLGATLFEVCTGAPLRTAATSAEAFAHARDDIAAHVERSLSELAPELAAIVTRAVARDPAARYDDARAMASDLAAYLDGRRVTAHAYSSRELLVRFVRAWRVPLIVTASALIIVSVLVVLGMQRLSHEAERAEHAERRTRVALDEASTDLGRALLTQALLESDDGARAEAEILAAHALTHTESPVARGVIAAWGAEPAPELVSRHKLPSCPRIDIAGATLFCISDDALGAWDIRGAPTLRWRVPLAVTEATMAAGYVAVRKTFRMLQWLDPATGATITTRSTVAADRIIGGTVLHAFDTGTFTLAEGPHAPEVPFRPCVDRYIGGLAYAPDERTWTVACADGTMVSGHDPDPATWTYRDTPLKGEQMIMSLAYLSPERLVAGTNTGDIVFIDSASGQILERLPTGFTKVFSVELSADRRWAAVSSATGGVVVIDLAAGTIRGRLPFVATRAVAFDGDELLIAGNELLRYRLRPGLFAEVPLGAGLTWVGFDPAMRFIAMTTGSLLVVRRVVDGTVVARDVPWRGFIKGAAFSVDGETLHTNLVRDPRIHNFDTTTWQEGPTLLATIAAHVRRMSALADGCVLYAQYMGGCWLACPTQADRAIVPRYDRMADIGASPGGQFAATLHEEGSRVGRFVLATGQYDEIATAPSASAVAIARDGETIATAEAGGIQLWAASGAISGFLDAGTTELVEVALSEDGHWIAAGGRDGSLWLWDLASRALVVRLNAHTERVPTLAFSPDGRLLASGGWDGRVRLFDLTRLDAPARDVVRDVEARWATNLSAVLGEP